MRKTLLAGCVMLGACGGSGASADSATAHDSAIVAGTPAVPTTTVPADSTQTPAVTGVSKQTSTAPTPPARGAAKQPPPPPPVSAASTDSVRGIVSVTGTSFDKHVMVAGGGGRTEIIGSLTSLIGHVAGTEVSVVGKAVGKQLEATSFVVRSVDGQPAIDGTLKTEAGVLFITPVGGSRIRIANPPPPLLGIDGARVYITGDPSKGVSTFGFIDPPR